MANARHSVEWALKISTEGSAQVQALKRDLDSIAQIDSFAKLKRDVVNVQNEWKTATKNVSEFARTMGDVEKPTKKMEAELERARATAGRLKDAYEKLSAKPNEQRASLADQGVSTQALVAARRNLIAKTEAAAKKERELADAGVATAKRVSGEMDRVAAAILSVGVKGIGPVSAQLTTLGRVEAFKNLKRDTIEAEKEWRSATARVAELATVLRTTGGSKIAVSADFERAKAQATELKDRYIQQRDALNEQRRALDLAGVSTARLAAEQRRVAGLSGERLRMTRAVSGAEEDMAAIGIRSNRAIKAEIDKVTDALSRLRKNEALAWSGDVARASGVAKTKLAELQRELLDSGSASEKAAAKQGVFHRAMGVTDAVVTKTTGVVTGLVGAYVGMNAIQLGSQYMIQNLRSAEQSTYNLEASVKSATREFGLSAGTLDVWGGKLQDLGKELLIYSNSDLRKAASRTIDMTKRLGLSVDQMAAVVRVAGDLGAGKTNLEGGVERLTAALRGEAEAAEFLGLTLGETYVRSWYEANDATGKAWKNLTDVEKAQIRYKIVLEQTDGMQGRAAGSISTLNGAMSFMKATIDNTLESNGDLRESMRGLAKDLADAAPKIVSATRGIVGLVNSLVALMGALPSGAGDALAAGFLTKWLFGAATSIFPSLVATLGIVPGQVGAIVGAYVLAMEKISQYAQNQQGTPQWLVDADQKIKALLSTLNSGNAESVRAGLEEGRARIEQTRVALEQERAIRDTARGQDIAAERDSSRLKADMVTELASLRFKKWDEVLAKAKSSLKEAVDEERAAAEQIRAIQQQMTDATRSTDALVRETLRSTMSQGQQYQDKLAEAKQTMTAAAAALASGDAEQARKLYEEAQRQFAMLRTEVKEGEKVVVSSAQAQATALDGIKEAGKGIQDALNIDKIIAEAQFGIAEDKKERIMEDINDIHTAMSRIKDIDVSVRANDYASEKLQEIYNELAKLKDKTITITTRYVTEGGGSGGSSGSSGGSGDSFGSDSTYGGQSGYGYAQGGRVGFAAGGRTFSGKLPGYSPGVDNLLGMLRSGLVFGLGGGEDVTNARSTQIIYQTIPGLMPLLNRVRSSGDVYAVLLKALGNRGKAVPDISRLTKHMNGYAQGGVIRESYRVTLAVPSAGVESTVTTASKAEATSLVALAKALDRARLVGGKA